MPLLMLAACDGGGPTQPTVSSQSTGFGFKVAGLVTDEYGAPMPGATVTMSHWSGGTGVGVGTVHWPSTLTDASGNYSIAFTASPMGNGFVARAQVVAEGYEEHWRDIMRSTGTSAFVENFRLDRITRIAAGESTVLSVPPDVGGCRGWVAPVCPPVRVTVPARGHLSIEVTPVGHRSIEVNPPGYSGELPPVEICCVEGDERYGNPITIPVAPGPELEVRVGLRRGLATPVSFLVKTSLEPF
jgi:hypothetical protein